MIDEDMDTDDMIYGIRDGRDTEIVRRWDEEEYAEYARIMGCRVVGVHNNPLTV